MSYGKASELLTLAMDVASRRFGMPYSLIDERSDAPSADGRRRNTQRLVRALEATFPGQVTADFNDEGEKCVFLESGRLRELAELQSDEMTALDRAIETLRMANAVLDAESLERLRTKVRLMAPAKKLGRLEVDYEALLAASHVVARPGPRPNIDPTSMRPITESLLALKMISFDYSRAEGKVRRRAHPYGIVSGHRAYLLARLDGAPDDRLSTFRIDRMDGITVEDEPSTVPADFDIHAYSKRSFGVFHSSKEHGEVVWRFKPQVAENVLSYQFHPDQEFTVESDGSVTVRFVAGGWLEMAWALYPWGDRVEVLKPEALREFVTGYQRSDFTGVP